MTLFPYTLRSSSVFHSASTRNRYCVVRPTFQGHLCSAFLNKRTLKNKFFKGASDIIRNCHCNYRPIHLHTDQVDLAFEKGYFGRTEWVIYENPGHNQHLNKNVFINTGRRENTPLTSLSRVCHYRKLLKRRTTAGVDFLRSFWGWRSITTAVTPPAIRGRILPLYHSRNSRGPSVTSIENLIV